MADDSHKRTNHFAGCLLVGKQYGLLKHLSGFDKSRHTVPKFANDRARVFLGKICRRELEEWAEALYSDLRVELEYKRKEISLACSDGTALIRSKDFEIQRQYSLCEDDLQTYQISTELVFLGSFDLAITDAFNATVGSLFDRMRCEFITALEVETIIDSIEARSDSQISVNYPSSFQYCDCRIHELDAVFRFTSQFLEIRFPAFNVPKQIVDAFIQLRESFAMDPLFAELLS